MGLVLAVIPLILVTFHFVSLEFLAKPGCGRGPKVVGKIDKEIFAELVISSFKSYSSSLQNSLQSKYNTVDSIVGTNKLPLL